MKIFLHSKNFPPGILRLHRTGLARNPVTVHLEPVSHTPSPPKASTSLALCPPCNVPGYLSFRRHSSSQPNWPWRYPRPWPCKRPYAPHSTIPAAAPSASQPYQGNAQTRGAGPHWRKCHDYDEQMCSHPQRASGSCRLIVCSIPSLSAYPDCCLRKGSPAFRQLCSCWAAKCKRVSCWAAQCDW